MHDADALRAIARGDLNPGRQWASPAVQGHVSDTADMRQNVPVLYALALMGPRILEVGTNDGTSTIAFLMGICDSRVADGSLLSIDIEDQPAAHEVVDRLDLRRQWTFERGDSHVVLPRLRAEGRRFQTILVDGDHTYGGAKQDIEDAEAMLEPGGVLITHDSLMLSDMTDWSQPSGMRGVRGCGLYAREMLRGDKWCGSILPQGCNLGIWRRRADLEAAYEDGVAHATREGVLPGRSDR